MGRILVIVGWLCVSGCVVVGGGFSAIALMGFVGTSGREAGGELVSLALGTLAGIVAGLYAVQVGLFLEARARRRAERARDRLG